MKGSASGQDSLLERVIAAEERQPLPRNSGATAEWLALETLLALTSFSGCMILTRVRAARCNAARPGMRRMPSSWRKLRSAFR